MVPADFEIGKLDELARSYPAVAADLRAIAAAVQEVAERGRSAVITREVHTSRALQSPWSVDVRRGSSPSASVTRSTSGITPPPPSASRRLWSPRRGRTRG